MLGHPGVSSRLQQLDVRASRQVHDARAPFGRIECQNRHLARPGYRSLDSHPRQLALELLERRGQARALEESAPGSRDRPHRLRREEPPLPDTVGLLMGDAASPMGFARPLKSRLDPGCPLPWVSTDKHVSFLEAFGASHARTKKPIVPLDPTKCLRASPSMWSRLPPASTTSIERTFSSSQPYS